MSGKVVLSELLINNDTSLVTHDRSFVPIETIVCKVILRQTGLLGDLVHIVTGYRLGGDKYADNWFTFHVRHRSYCEIPFRDLYYLEWLLSVSGSLQLYFPDVHRNSYDPFTDTVALVEVNILKTIGLLEQSLRFLNRRRELFRGGEPFRDIIHPTIAVYASLETFRVGKPQIDHSYLHREQGIHTQVSKLARHIASVTQTTAPSEPAFTKSIAFGDELNWKIPQFSSAALLAILARQQWVCGEILNFFNPAVRKIVDAITNQSSAESLNPLDHTSDLLRYLSIV
jgi:hypothetical protein